MNFVLSERPIGTRSVLLSLEGDTSPAAAQRVHERLAEVAARVDVGVVVVDLSPVSFVDSAMVQALCAAARDARPRGTRIIVVEPLDAQVAEPLQLGGVDAAAELVGTVEEAARRTGVPEERLKSAAPAPQRTAEVSARARRRMLGRRHQDQEILRELAQLRRMVQELSHAGAPPEPDGAGADPGIELDALRAQFDEARRMRDAARQEAAAARTEADALRAEADRMEDEAEQAHARVQALEGDLSAAHEAAESLRSELARQHGADEEAQARIQMLEADLARAETEAANVRADIERFENELAQARADADRMEDEAEQAHMHIQAVEAENARLRAETGPAAKPREPEPEPSQPPEPTPEPRKPEGPRPRVPVWADPRPINLNTADIDDLMLLPGIGRKPAERILAYRDERGGFNSVDELFAITEIPQDRLARIRPYVSV